MKEAVESVMGPVRPVKPVMGPVRPVKPVMGPVRPVKPVARGYTHNQRGVVTLREGRSVFAERAVDEETAGWLCQEFATHEVLDPVPSFPGFWAGPTVNDPSGSRGPVGHGVAATGGRGPDRRRDDDAHRRRRCPAAVWCTATSAATMSASEAVPLS